MWAPVLGNLPTCPFIPIDRKRWKHSETGRVLELKHDDHHTFHRKTTLSVDGVVHFEHHTDHFKNGDNADSAPRLCTPVCDCVMDKDNNCVADRLEKIGLLDEPSVNRYQQEHNEL